MFFGGMGCRLDYLYSGAGIVPVARLPPLDEFLLSADVALPSRVFPSDHLPLVVDYAITDTI